jgi:hypothetical protein
VVHQALSPAISKNRRESAADRAYYHVSMGKQAIFVYLFE